MAYSQRRQPRVPTSGRKLDRLLADIRACRVCVECPAGAPLPHAPRPIIRARSSARIAVAGQAPGVRVHASGKPFTDPSGDRLRAWLAVTPAQFYDQRKIAIVPMGFCFPGHDRAGGDLPPRRECARAWHTRLFALMPQLELVLLVGSYAQRWHLDTGQVSMTDVVGRWREQLGAAARPRRVALPHPSWRNNGWLGKNPYFEQDLLPELRRQVRTLITR